MQPKLLNACGGLASAARMLNVRIICTFNAHTHAHSGHVPYEWRVAVAIRVCQNMQMSRVFISKTHSQNYATRSVGQSVRC